MATTVYITNIAMTLVLGHWKFAIDKPLALWAQGLSCQTSSDLRLGLYIYYILLLGMYLGALSSKIIDISF